MVMDKLTHREQQAMLQKQRMLERQQMIEKQQMVEKQRQMEADAQQKELMMQKQQLKEMGDDLNADEIRVRIARFQVKFDSCRKLKK